MEKLLGDHVVWLLAITAIGSLVDMVQFVWIVKRTWRKFKRSMMRKIREEIREEEVRRGISGS